ncbi:MAG: tetratricopeptide repeat protein [Bacteroidales bacterium]
MSRPTYLILVDVDSLDQPDARKARILIGAFVDGLDPDDRVAILAVSGTASAVDPTTNRFAARAALESIEGRAVKPGAGMSLAEAIAVLTGDRRMLDRLQTEATANRGRGQGSYWERAQTIASGVVGPTNRLVVATSQLLQRPRTDTGRLAIVWLTNHLTSFGGTTDPAIERLALQTTAAHARISIVVPTRGASANMYEGYQVLASLSGGAVLSGLGNIDSSAMSLLKSTAGPEPRRPDPAGVSELTSLRRCAERSASRSPYVALIEQYWHGDANGAVATLGTWTALQLTGGVTPPPSVAELEAAIALHTEAGVQGGQAWRVNLGIARRAVEALWSRQLGNAVCRQWVVTMSAYSREMVRGLQVAGPESDPPVLVALGAAYEVPPSLETPGLDHVQSPTSDLSQAAELYRQALAKHASFVEARVRFGRVLGLLGEPQAAITELERVRTESKDPQLAYLASLFLGEIHEGSHNQKAALDAYRAAVLACPHGLAARAALARLLELSGQHVEATEVMRGQFAPIPGQAHARDPWQDYFHGSPDDLARELPALREAARK